MAYSEKDLELFNSPEKQLELLQKFVDEFDREYTEKVKKQKKSKKSKPSSETPLPPVDPLFSQPPNEKETKTGRVKYVTNENEKIPYPTPDQIVQNGDMTMQTTTLTIDFNNGPFSSLINGSKPAVDVPYEECPYFNKKIRFI